MQPSGTPSGRGRPKRVVQWATGAVGRHALTAIVDHPDLELVGVLVYSQDKAGRDAGDVCGIGPIGIVATADKDEIIALDADCVVYMPQGEMDPMGALADICALLESGKNVVSTAVTPFIYPAAAGRRVVERLSQACAAGGASFHATGIEPGWASEVLPLTMSGLFRYIDSLTVQELLDYSTYPSRDMLVDVMGFGLPPEAAVPGADPALLGGTFRAPLMLVAEGLGADDRGVRVRPPGRAGRSPVRGRSGPDRGRHRRRDAILGERDHRRSHGADHRAHHTSRAGRRSRLATWSRMEGHRRRPAVDDPGIEDRHQRRGRERPRVPRDGDACRARHRAGL